MWIDYHSSLGLNAPEEPISDHFCENEKDANELADLVNRGIKRATEYWRRVHIDFFMNQFATLGLTFNESTPFVFEEFEKVFPNS